MTDQPENPPAFPVTPTDKSGQIAPTEYGMSLRDWFAGQALAGMMANSSQLEGTIRDAKAGRAGMSAMEAIATTAYAIADAMIRERQKGQTK